MGFLELFLIGVGLSMDAFAVAVCQGLCMPRLNLRFALVIALFFGGFQALMPFAGWLLGAQFAGYIQQIDHWLAFVLLAVIGGKMLWESFFGQEEETACAAGVVLDYRQLFLMAVATSIDALAVGVTFAFLEVQIHHHHRLHHLRYLPGGRGHRRLLRRTAPSLGRGRGWGHPGASGLQDPAGTPGPAPLTHGGVADVQL